MGMPPVLYSLCTAFSIMDDFRGGTREGVGRLYSSRSMLAPRWRVKNSLI